MISRSDELWAGQVGHWAISMQIMAGAGGRAALHNNHPCQWAPAQTLLSIADETWSERIKRTDMRNIEEYSMTAPHNKWTSK